MTEIQKTKRYDLEDRTFYYAQRVISYVDNLPQTVSNLEIGKQLVRAAGSVGANYIEANEALSKKDFLMRVKISRKETKESRYWIKLSAPKEEMMEEKECLVREATELMKIFGAIVTKSS